MSISTTPTECNQKVIYTIGDSHSWHCWLKIPGVITRPQGPMTMFSFGLHKPVVTFEIPLEAIVCFCWGEIDCRCHVHKYQPWEETIDTLAREYLEAIRINTKGRKHVWIYNVVPPPRMKEGLIINPAFPFLGSDEDRLKYVRRLNDRLRASEFTFVDVYDQYSDKDGFLDMTKSDNHVHVEVEGPLKAWVEKKLEEIK